MLSFLVVVASMPAMVLSIGKSPANANAEGHHTTEQDRYLEIAQDLGDAWTKQLMVRVLADRDFSGGCKVAAENMQELADEITTHNDKNLERMKQKARSSLDQIETLKSDWNKHWEHSDNHSQIAELVKDKRENPRPSPGDFLNSRF